MGGSELNNQLTGSILLAQSIGVTQVECVQSIMDLSRAGPESNICDIGYYQKRLRITPEMKKQKVIRLAKEKMIASFGFYNKKNHPIINDFRTRKKVYGVNAFQQLYSVR